MRYYTHITFCIFVGLVFNLDLWIILIAALFSLLPDIDQVHSKYGRKIWPLNLFMKHRGMMHSVWFLGLGTLFFDLFNRDIAIAYLLGFGSHLMTDILNYKGIQPFYPIPFKLKGFVKTGSMVENLLFMVFLTLIVLMTVRHYF